MATRPLIKESLSLLNVCGLHPTKQNVWSKLKILLVISIYLHLMCELLLNMIYNPNQNDFIDAFTPLGVLIQLLSKIATITINRKSLAKLLLSMNGLTYWNTCNEKLQQKLQEVYGFFKTALQVFAVGCVFTAIAYFSRPILTNVKALPFGTYHPNDDANHYLYYTMYFLQAFDVTVAAFILFGFDGLFISFIVHIICELKIVKYEFSTLKMNAEKHVDSKKVTGLINRHSFALLCIRDIDKIYSMLLLNQFSCSIISLCFGLLTLTINAEGHLPDISTLSKYATYVSSILLQLFIYCFIGMYLTTESESVSDAVYNSKWYYRDTKPQLRKACVIFIQRAHKKECLTAGGMINLNLENFTNIVRTAFSFFTLMQAMYSKSN